MSVEFDSGLAEGKLLADGAAGGVAPRHAGGHMGGEFFERGNAPVQALAGDGRAFEFDHVELGRVFRRVVDLEARGQRASLGRGQVLVKGGIGVGIEAVLHEHDFFSLWVGGSQTLQKAVIVGPGAAGRNLDQALARARFKGGQQASRALAHVGAAFAPGLASFGRLLAYRRLGRHGW